MDDDETVGAIMDAFPGTTIVDPELPPIVQVGPIGGCVYCGRMCVTRVEGPHQAVKARRGPHHPDGEGVEMWPETPTTPVHEACLADWASGKRHASQTPVAGAWARRDTV